MNSAKLSTDQFHAQNFSLPKASSFKQLYIVWCDPAKFCNVLFERKLMFGGVAYVHNFKKEASE
jgi:hypothetical protein